MTILELKQRHWNRNHCNTTNTAELLLVLPTTTTTTTITTSRQQQQQQQYNSNKLRPYKKQLALPFKKFQKYISTTTRKNNHPFSKLPTSTTTPIPLNEYTKSSLEKTKKITVSSLTYGIIKLETERLLYEANRTKRPVTVQSMSNALIGSRHIQESYVATSLSSSAAAASKLSLSSTLSTGGTISNVRFRSTTNALSSFVASSIISIPFFQQQSRNNHHQQQQQQQRVRTETKYKYEWMKIMNQLQNERTAQEQIITNWEDAQRVLSTVLQVEDDDDNDNDDDNTKNNNNDNDTNDGEENNTNGNSAESSKGGAMVVVNSKSNAIPPSKKSSTDSVVDAYIKRLEALKLEHIHQSMIGLSPSQHKWQEIAIRSKKKDNKDDEIIDLEKGLTYEEQKIKEEQEQLDKEYKKLEDKLKSPAIQEVDEIYEKEKEQASKVHELLQSLLRPLTKDEQALVQSELYNTRSNPNEIIAQVGTDTLVRRSLQTLIPGSWLNDEVVHYFLIMLTKRDEILCQQQSSPGRKRCHFFKSFFMTKLRNEGHPTLSGQYDYKQVKRWSKNVPGKDLFALDKIIFPINEGQMHWICACIFMSEKRIQVYDSLGSSGIEYCNDLFRYIQDEHMDKKKQPLPDPEQWQLIPCTKDTPRQCNGYDCGVFTCMFADFLAMDYPLVFGQQHVTECRQRIALSILQGKAIM